MGASADMPAGGREAEPVCGFDAVGLTEEALSGGLSGLPPSYFNLGQMRCPETVGHPGLRRPRAYAGQENRRTTATIIIPCPDIACPALYAVDDPGGKAGHDVEMRGDVDPQIDRDSAVIPARLVAAGAVGAVVNEAKAVHRG